MSVYFVTGKLGSGKSLCSVGRIQDYLFDGRPVATNLELNLDKLISVNNRNAVVYRLPDKPNVDDLNAIGIGNATYDESKNGLLVLDECGTWFNSRSWADKSRQPLINWMLHARKKGWDVFFIVQDIAIVDKQAREALAEHVVYCKRLDRVPIPLIGFIWKMFTGKPLPFPRLHIATVKYGDQKNSMTVDNWIYRGLMMQAGYDTKQAFSDFYSHGVFSYLPPWYTKGRYRVLRDGAFYMRLTKIYWKRYSRVAVAVSGVLLGSMATGLFMYKPKPKPVNAFALPAKAANKVDEKVITLVDLFDGYHLAAHITSSTEGSSFVFSHDKKPSIWSNSTKIAGVSFQPYSTHSMRVVRGSEYLEFTY